ncbi:MAG TPA: endonuclease V [Thermotogota bacterium]|nr:endonuclease V [Thermotogota bacterium]HRW35685.1 endonuclease V [Thermotogota bacterium]
MEADEALEIQKELVKNLRFSPLGQMPRLIAGVDSSFFTVEDKEYILTVIVVLSFPDLEYVEKKYLTNRVTFPYIPGLLTFREGPSFIKTWKRLHSEPEVVFFDGQGTAHPRGLGLASHMGLFLERPTIGVAKSKLYGEADGMPEKLGEWFALRNPEKNVIGSVLCTKKETKPLYISPGHLITLEDTMRLVMSCLNGFKIPEPTRQAHILSQKIKREKQEE